MCSRSLRSSAPSGSSSRSTSGSRTMQRAMATRCFCRRKVRRPCACRCRAGRCVRGPPPPCGRSRRFEPLPAQAVADVVGNVHHRKEREVLEHHVDRALVGRDVGHRAALDADVARGRVEEARDHPHDRGLAAARGAEDRKERPARHVEGDVIHGKRLAEPLHEAVAFEIGGHVAPMPAGTQAPRPGLAVNWRPGPGRGRHPRWLRGRRERWDTT